MTEIGEMSEEWKFVTLGEAVEINGASRDPTRENPDEKILYIDIESVEGGTGIIKTAKEILGKEAPSRARRVVHQNDIIMSTVRPYLKAFALVPREYNNQICSTGFAVLSCKNQIFPRYLLYTLFSKEVIEQCNKMMMGGQYPALNQSQVAKIEIPLPPLPEQRRIAEVLGTVDSAIQKVGSAIERTERLKKGLMQRLLTKGIGHERFKFSKELGCEIPEEWVVTQMKEAVVSYKNGIYKPSEFYGTGYPSIRMYNIRQGRINIIKAPLLQVTEQELEDYGLEEGDILINRVNTAELVGRAGVVPRGIGKITFESKNIRVRLNKTKVFPDFFSVYVQTAAYAKQIRSKAKTAVAQATITQDDIDNVLFPIPPLPEQRRIAEILSAVDRKLELSRRRKEKLSRVKKGLMSELLTGRKRVKI